MPTNPKIITSIILSALTALSIVYVNDKFILGLNPFIGYILAGVILLALLVHLVYIFRISRRTLKLILLIFYFICLVGPIVYIKFRPMPHSDMPARHYFEAK